MFILRAFQFLRSNGKIGLMTPFVWMFLQSFSKLRARILNDHHICSLIQPEYHAFFDSAFVPICAFVVEKNSCTSKATFVRLTDFYGYDLQSQKTLEAIHDATCGWRYDIDPRKLAAIPGQPIAYWIQKIDNFLRGKVGEHVISGGRCKTHNDEQYVRYHWEIARNSTKWRLYLKGGSFRKFYGNELHVVNWSDAARLEYDRHGGLNAQNFWGKKGLTWSLITSSLSSFRLKQSHCEYSSGSPTLFNESYSYDFTLLGYLNSKVAAYYLKALNPTLNTTVNDVFSLPFIPLAPNTERCLIQEVEQSIEISKADWDSLECSWDFQRLPLPSDSDTLRQSYHHLWSERSAAIKRMKRVEEEINSILISAYGLEDEISPEVPEDQITLARPDREEDLRSLISYAIGCMMGRYSLDKPGLIYAHSGNKGFDPSQYQTFPADDDGIIPMMETDWFSDDASTRLVEFISVTWPKEHLEENLTFIADSLGPNRNEQSRDTIRRYFATGFYKHHLSMYKRRPIYWLFSSGKQRAFQCLVYLHRYHEGTLSRMRTEYVIPLQGKIASRLDQLADDIAAASSTAHRKRLEKERETLRKQHTELQAFDEQLRHYADQRIILDLDDRVKVNYGKFDDLLAEVKAVTGGTMDEAP
jgi:hypothetical protein